MNQQTNDIANKYGVVTFETAKKLDWKEETNFLYLGTSQLTLEECMADKEIIKPLKFRLCTPTVHKGAKFEHNNLYCFEDQEEYPDFRRKGSQEFYYAPQMHNLFNVIPDTIPYKVYNGSEISEFSLKINKEAVYYDSRIFTDKTFYTSIVDNNYAEAYAKIYLLLKENGYIK